MGMKTKPSKASAKKVVMPSKEAIMDCNNNEAGELLLSKLVNDKTIEYASRDIMLSDIRLNPDNEVFRQDDNDEDIKTLAEDIERNGLMHNLVVLPQQEGKNLPDGNFPTVAYPNPESPKAFELALKLAKEVDADIVLATDPDADRLGVYSIRFCVQC